MLESTRESFLGGVNHLYVVTHTDLDGVGSAAAILRIAGRRLGRDSTVAFTEPYELHELLESLEGYLERGDALVIADLGLNSDTREPIREVLGKVVARGVRVEWYDHHVWGEDDLEGLRRLGAAVHVDRSTCATGVIVRYAPRVWGVEPDSFLEELSKAVCSADLWRWDHSLSPKLFRAVGSREASREWRLKVIEKFLSGTLWDEEMEKRLEEYVSEELRNVSSILKTVYVAEVGGLRIASAYKENGPPANSIVGALLTARYKADIAVIVRPNGGISLRSGKINVQKIAAKLGGGGHPRAAGAKIEIPLWIKIASMVTPKALPYYATRKVAKALEGNIEHLSETPQTHEYRSPHT